MPKQNDLGNTHSSELPKAQPGLSIYSKTRGFTLIELLAVITIVGILAGLLLSALATAKNKARSIDCINRQKQWAMAFSQYADDNNDWIPREGFDRGGQVWWNNWAQVRDSRSSDAWYNGLESYVGRPPASSYALRSKRAPFYGYSSFFHCPSARFPELARYPGYEIALFSIAMNSQLIEPPDSSIRSDRVRNPSQTALFLDNLLEEEKPVVRQQAADNLGQPSAFANRFAGRRHGRSGVIAFADGRVEAKRGDDVVETSGRYIGWAKIPEKDVVWHLE